MTSATAAPFVYLASQSPRRSQLLEQLGLAHELLLADPDEDAESLEDLLPAEAPARYVVRVTGLKLEAAVARHRARKLPPAPILCADTTVALGRRMLGKPDSPEHAAEMLRALSGRSHRVLTAVAVGAGAGAAHILALSVSRVRFAALSQRSIELYVASGEPRGKAGAYAIQGRIAAWIEHIEGSYSGVMGLPLHETAQLLARASVRMDL